MDLNKNNPSCTVGQFPHCKTAAGQGTRRRGLESKAVCQVLWGSCLPGRPASFPFAQKDTGSHEEAPFTTSHKHVLSAAMPGERHGACLRGAYSERCLSFQTGYCSHILPSDMKSSRASLFAWPHVLCCWCNNEPQMVPDLQKSTVM